MLRTITALAVAALVITLAALAAGSAFATVHHPAAAAAPACRTEDSPGPCTWDARVQGNGRGQSFTRTAGQHVLYAPHRMTWHAVLRHCHVTHACHTVPAAVRRFYGIKPGDPARIQYGGTTWTWWLHAGHVHRAAS